MPTNEIRMYDSNGDMDIESTIDRFKHLDSKPVIDSEYDSASHPPEVENALWRLRTLQMIKDTKESAERFKRFNDAFSNPAAKTGWGEENLMNATQYPLTRLTQDWQLLTSLYRSSWIVQRVCNVIPEDALADLSVEAPGLETEQLHKLEEEIRSTHLRESILEGLRWGRLYGGAAAIIMISGQEEDMSLPLDINNIMPGSFHGLYVVDRWSGIYPGLDLVDNERDPDFGLPEYYEVRDETGGGSYRVHHSRVLCFRGIQMPYWEQQAEQYWGTSEIEAMYDELIKRDNVAHNIANLTFKANLNVLQVKDLNQMFASSSTANQRRIYEMLSAINTLENSLGVRVIDQNESIQQLQYSFSGLPEVMDSAMMDMSGATRIPATRLFGRSPAGMNSTGESDEKMYRQTLEQERAVHIVPVLEKLIPIVCHSAIGMFPAGAKFKFPPLIELTVDQKAQIVDQRSTALERLFQSNLIPADAVLESFRNSQIEMDLTSVITDKMIEHVKGKYMNDLQQQQADPYGGAMQAANEAGVTPDSGQVDENGNPVDENGNPIPTDENGNPVDENGNPIPQDNQEQQVDENGNPVEQEEPSQDEIDAAKEDYKGIAKAVSPKISQDLVAQLAMNEKISPDKLKQSLQERKKRLLKRKRLLKQYERIIKSEPAEVAQDLVAEQAVLNELSPDDFAAQMEQQQQMIDAGNQQQQPQQQNQEQQEQPQEEQQQNMKKEQRQDMRNDSDYYPRFKKIKHMKNFEDEDFRYEKFRKSNKNKKSRGFDY